MKFKKGDKVIVITGKHKGTKTSIKKVVGTRVVVEGVAKIKRHQKARRTTEKGTIVEKESSIHASNIMFLDPSTDKQTRVGKRTVNEKRVRFAKKSGKEI